MSWSIYVNGVGGAVGEKRLVPVAEAREQVLKARCYEQQFQEGSNVGTPNERQFEAARAVILGELARLPEGQGVHVEASGHADNTAYTDRPCSQFRLVMHTGPMPKEAPAAEEPRELAATG